MRRVLSILALVSLLLLAGCATQKRSDTLDTTLRAYASAVRWGDFQSAVVFLDPKTRADKMPTALDLARYKLVQVSGYDAGNGPVPDGANQVRQIVHINLINVSTQSERSIVDRQTWRYDETTKHWWLTSGLPDITQQQ
jgi:outer membrane murein-binding lipoprotein Lpp